MIVGECYRVKPVFTAAKDGQRPVTMTGKVLYVHPKKRFAVLEFTKGIRECFCPEQLTEENRVRDRNRR